jgi:hypothetical protein
VAHRDQQRLRQPQGERDRRDQCDSEQKTAPGRRFEQAQQRDGGGQGGADEDRDDPVSIRDRQRNQLGRFLDLEILRRRQQDLEDEDDDQEGADRTEQAAPLRPE